MKKYNIRIQRIEYYSTDIEVEAENVDAAVENIREREEANEFVEMFDCPDDVETHVYCTDEESYGEPKGFCGNCRRCRGVYVGTDKCVCAINDPHAEPDNNEPCPNWIFE